MDTSIEREFGIQPLDQVMSEMGLENRDLVATSTDQLTHKQVQKARRGRYVTRNIQGKILAALNKIASMKEEGKETDPRTFLRDDLFTYRP